MATKQELKDLLAVAADAAEDLGFAALAAELLQKVAAVDEMVAVPTPTPLVRLRWRQETASGRRTSWARTCHGIIEGRGAKAIVGEYLRDGEEVDLPLNSIVVEVRPEGSVKNGWEECRLRRVTAEGLDGGENLGNWRSNWLSIRDRLAALTTKVL